tara:strand:+ start:288 stop:3188 length:2901 start_codon:yes stop_codon:yes gene_type:complete
MFLRYWITKNNIDNYGWEGLSANPNAIKILEERIEYEKTLTKTEYDSLKSKIDWCKLFTNPAILLYLLNDFNFVKDKYLYSLLIDPNKSNQLLILQFKDKYLKGLSSNPNAIKILENNLDIIDYSRLSANPNAIKLLNNKPDYIDNDNLFLNPNGSKLLRSEYKPTEQLKIKKICRSNDIEAIKKLENPDWDELYSNPSVIDLIHKKVNKETLSIPQKIFENPNIFITDKELKSKLKKWRNNPEINPYTDEIIAVSIVSNKEYVKLYKSFLEYLVSINEPNITSKLPRSHYYTITSTSIDLSFYKRNGKEVKLKKFEFDYLFTVYYLKDNNVIEFNRNYFLYNIILRQFEVNSNLAATYPAIPDVLKDIMLDENLEVFIEMVNEYIYDLCILLLPLTKLANRIELEQPEYISYFEEMLYIDINVLPETIKNMKNRLHFILHLINLFGKEDIFERIKETKLDDHYFDDYYVNIIYNCIIKEDNKKFRNFLVSVIFDIEEIHIESNKQVVYNFVKDPYDNLPTQPEIPKYPILSQELILYKSRKSNLELNISKASQEDLVELKIKLTNLIDNDKDRQLKEYSKKINEYNIQIKEYDQKIKAYNKQHLGKKISPYFSVSISRSKDELEYSYNPIKTTQRSLSAFSKKRESSSNNTLYEHSSDVILTDELKSKFYRYIYDGTDIENSEEQEELLIEFNIAELNGKISNSRAKQLMEYSGGGKKSLSAIKAELKLDAKRLDKVFKNRCDLTGNEPFTMELYADMHAKKIKYLSKIKTVINGKTYVNCYDTVNIYNYVLNCYKTGKVPENIALGRRPFTRDNLKEIFKKIKHFTKQKTLEVNDNIYKNIRLVGIAKAIEENEYNISLKIKIGTVDFPIFLGKIDDDNDFYIHKGELFTMDETNYDNSSDKTIIVIQKGISNGRLLEQFHYPYIPTRLIKKTNNILPLPKFPDIGTLEEKTRQFNDQLDLLVA